ncbi:YbhB/YbcL family Raf kinase inhibitor-like protein [Paenibacillus thalictri]|uniref:YbhB/YbcL family Raf kinase inhibitor-like protein n=1 Tax=Paenibacillus thalictri TaxID=2527873 RepID=A0A4Q9DI08_9BACL|nr:YbhB/YbcL family Raf kinase inhibitor-like protein [Paenibacillus thalictri]TBL72643.1 YbhB/YbcL family Raf kinase inhibitor-like protein [Paenibacillus thalictri]
MKFYSKRNLLGRCIIVMLILSLAFSSLGIVSAEDGSKDIKGHWAERQLQSWITKGFIQGYADGSIRPDTSVTRAEWMTLANRAFGLSEKAAVTASDVNPQSWEYEQAAIAIKAGYVSGYEDGTLRLGNDVTRQETAAMIVKLLQLDQGQLSALDRFRDKADLPEWSKGPLAAVVSKGILDGYENGTLGFNRSVTRAEAVVILDRALQGGSKTAFHQAGTFGPAAGNETITGDVLINASGVTLRNVTISGSLTLGEAIGEGDVTLQNVTVKGDTYVYGGGSNSIHLKDSVLVTILVNKKTGEVRIVAEGKTSVKQVDVRTGAIFDGSNATGSGFSNVRLQEQLPANSKVTLLGQFESLDISAQSIIVDIPSGSVNNVTVSEQGGNSSIRLGKDSKIVELVLNAVTKVLGEGKVDKATLGKGAENSTFQTAPASFSSSGSSGSGGGGGGGGYSPYIEFIAAPTATPVSGQVTVGTAVYLSTTTANAAIHYTLDGSSPTVASSVYSSPIIVNSNMTVKAIAAKNGRTSETSVFTYTVPAVPDTEPPASVTGLVYRDVTWSSLTLAWNPASDNVGTVGYAVYQNGAKIATVTDTVYQVTGLAPSTPYLFGVSAYDAAGNSSGLTTVSATTYAYSPALFTVSTTAFSGGGAIPVQYAYDGEGWIGAANTSIPVSWTNPPPDTRSFVVIVYDPDASDFLHWTAINIPASVTSLAEGASRTAMPSGSVELGSHLDGKAGYGGPFPPAGAPHHYHVAVYALNTDHLEGFTEIPGYPLMDSYSGLISKMNGKILASAETVGTFQFQSNLIPALAVKEVTAKDNTSARVSFNTTPSAAPVAGDFTFDNGLTVTAVAIDYTLYPFKHFTITTSSQTQGQNYHLSYKGAPSGLTLVGAGN